MAKAHAHILPDTNQSIWQLAAIQLTAVTSLPVLTTSILIYQDSNLLSAILTLILGNILLWIIRIGIVAMSYKDRDSTLDIALNYLGRKGGYIVAIILLLASLAWFIAQTTIASNALTYLMPLKENPEINRFIQISVALGIISTLFCMEGITVLRRLCTTVFPILLIAFIAVLIFAPTTLPPTTKNGISFIGLPLVLGTNLGVTADLPTFFRHGKSWRACLHAISIMQVVSLGLGIGGLYLAAIIEPWFGINESQTALLDPALRTSLIVLIFISAICANVANVYSASVGWELLAPASLVGRKEYLILGLGLTTLFILLSNVFSMDLLLETTDNGLVNLCIILIIGYLIRLLKGPPSTLDKNLYFSAWFIATLINLFQVTHLFLASHSPLITSFFAILALVTLYLISKPLLGISRK